MHMFKVAGLLILQSLAISLGLICLLVGRVVKLYTPVRDILLQNVVLSILGIVTTLLLLPVDLSKDAQDKFCQVISTVAIMAFVIKQSMYPGLVVFTYTIVAIGPRDATTIQSFQQRSAVAIITLSWMVGLAVGLVFTLTKLPRSGSLSWRCVTIENHAPLFVAVFAPVFILISAHFYIRLVWMAASVSSKVYVIESAGSKVIPRHKSPNTPHFSRPQTQQQQERPREKTSENRVYATSHVDDDKQVSEKESSHEQHEEQHRSSDPHVSRASLMVSCECTTQGQTQERGSIFVATLTSTTSPLVTDLAQPPVLTCKQRVDVNPRSVQPNIHTEHKKKRHDKHSLGTGSYVRVLTLLGIALGVNWLITYGPIIVGIILTSRGNRPFWFSPYLMAMETIVHAFIGLVIVMRNLKLQVKECKVPPTHIPRSVTIPSPRLPQRRLVQISNCHSFADDIQQPAVCTRLVSSPQTHTRSHTNRDGQKSIQRRWSVTQEDNPSKICPENESLRGRLPRTFQKCKSTRSLDLSTQQDCMTVLSRTTSEELMTTANVDSVLLGSVPLQMQRLRPLSRERKKVGLPTLETIVSQTEHSALHKSTSLMDESFHLTAENDGPVN